MKFLKVFLLVLVFIMAFSVLAACGGGEPEVTESADNDTVTTDAPATEPPVIMAEVEDGAVYSFKTEDYFSISGATFGTVDGEKVQVRGYREDLDQLWYLLLQEDGTYKIKNATSGLYLTVRLASKNEGSALVLASDNTKHAQNWAIIKKDNGVVIKNAVTEGYVKIKEPDTASDAVQTLVEDSAAIWLFKKELDKDTALPSILRLQGDNMAPASCPEIFKYNGVYYNINMTGGMKIKTSTDLVNWSSHTTVFSTKPAWIKKELGYDSIWAPGYYMVGDTLRIYYCASSSGSRNSLIGMVECKTPSGAFIDKGMVIRSTDSTPYNCIDPNIFTDDDGTVYLVWGSYAEGIYMRKLNAETGLLDESDTTLHRLADAPDGMEAPYLIKKDGYYYLFVAMGNMSKHENYHWAVGRSESIFGPYVDKKGRPMLEGYTSPLTEYKPGVQAVAHAQPFLDDDGQWYLVSEMWMDRSDPNKKIQLHISTMVWNDAGWPVTALSTDLLDELEGKK